MTGQDTFGAFKGEWLAAQAERCMEAIRSACGGKAPGMISELARCAAQHELTIAFVYREGPAKGVVMEGPDGERIALVFFGSDIWACYRVAIHEWAEHLMRIECCEPCVYVEAGCDVRHEIADMVAQTCYAEASAVHAVCSSLVPKAERRRRTRLTYSLVATLP